MKITFVLPGIAISGGVRSTFELANRLQSRGHAVSVVYSMTASRFQDNRRYYKESLKQMFAAKRRICVEGEEVDWFDLRANVIRVPILKNRYIPKGDIIVATWWANAYDVDGFKPNKGKKFYLIRSYETWGGPENLVNGTYTLDLHRIVTSTCLKEFIEGKFHVQTMGHLLNGINFDLFYKEGNCFEDNHPKRIGILYRQQKLKGIKDGIEAFLIAKKKYPDIQLVVFGEDISDEDNEIISKVDNVEFHKMLYKDKLRRIYNSLDIFIFPSHYEGFGNPPMEAMACGAACVTTNVGAVPDYTIAGKTALISPPKAPEALGENIIVLLENEERRKQIAENGHHHIKQFTWERTTDELEKLFEQYGQPVNSSTTA